MSFISWAWKGIKQIKNADYFGVHINFRYANRPKYRSVFGGIVFITYFIFSISYILLNFQNFVNRTTMNLVFNEGYQEKAPEINFSKYTMAFALGLSTKNSLKVPLLSKYFDIAFTAVSVLKINGTSISNKTSIPLVPCQPEMFYNLLNNSFTTQGLNNFFCPNISELSVQGIYTESVFKYLDFATSIKKEYYANTTEIKNLFMTDEIQANFYYIDTSVSVYNYSQPIQYFLNNKFANLDFGYYKKINLDFMQMTWISDANILFQEGDSSNYVVLDSFYEYFSNLGLDRVEKKVRDYQTLCKFYIRSSTRNRLIKRVYIKITEYLAQMSSILSSSLLILYVMVSYLNLFKAQQSIMKKIMKFKENLNIKNGESIVYLKSKFTNRYSIRAQETQNRMSNETGLTEHALHSIPRSSKVQIEFKTPIVRKLCREMGEKDFKKSSYKKDQIIMNYNIWQILLKLFCPCFQNKRYKNKEKLFERGYKKFSYDMNILTYIRKMHEMDILKYLILNEQEITLFNFLSKPSVSLISQNMLIESLSEKFNVKFNKEEIDTLHKNFNKLSVSNDQSKFEKKLLTLVTSEIDNLTM